jgi:pimeloyl-ACP methyl ester carboxylesterase
VILLHGWLGSWALWRSTIEDLGAEYRTYAIDFFGFGESRSHEVSVDLYIDLVNQFMHRLGIQRAALVGHSMGGTVSLGVAARYPERVAKVTVIGSPIVGSSLNVFLKLSGYRYVANLSYKVPLVKDSLIYLLTRFGGPNGALTYEMVREDAAKVAPDAFFQSIGTLAQVDLTPDLPRLNIPILGMYGRRDLIVKPDQGKLLVRHAPHAQEDWYENAGHFPMMDTPDRFRAALRGFLASSGQPTRPNGG